MITRHKPYEPVVSKPPDLTESVVKVLQNAPFPISAEQICILLGILDKDQASKTSTAAVNAVLLHKGNAGKFVRTGTLWSLPADVLPVAKLLVTEEYSQLGLEVFGGKLRHVIPEMEQHFVETRDSRIPGAGRGLFIKPGIHVSAGTLLCEYRGITQKSTNPREQLLPYTIRTFDGTLIHGCDAQGRLLCLAAAINDGGPDAQNVEFQEVDGFPDRVFIVTLRDMLPSEELFTLYGAGYWGASEYSTIETEQNRKRRQKAPARKRKLIDTQLLDSDEFPVTCRSCKMVFPKREKIIHQLVCNVVSLRPSRFESLPCTPLTCLEYRDGAWANDARRNRAITFVRSEVELTAFNTHCELFDASDGEGDSLPAARKKK